MRSTQSPVSAAGSTIASYFLCLYRMSFEYLSGCYPIRFLHFEYFHETFYNTALMSQGIHKKLHADVAVIKLKAEPDCMTSKKIRGLNCVWEGMHRWGFWRSHGNVGRL